MGIYFGQFLTQADFDVGRQTGKTVQPVPGRWFRYDNIQAAEKRHGFATYRLRILLPKAGMALGVFVPPVGSNAAVYANGRLVGQAGEPSMLPYTQAGERSMLPLGFHFTADQEELTLIWHVSSQVSNGSGISHEPLFGTEEAILRHQANRLVTDAVLIAILGVVGLFSFVLSRQGGLMTRGGVSLALYCLVIMLYTSTQSQAILLRLLPGMDHYRVFLKIRYGLLILQPYMLFHMAHRVVGVPMCRRVRWMGRAVTGAALLLDIFTRAYASVAVMSMYIALTFVGIIALLALMARQARRSSDGSYYLYAAMLCAAAIPFANMITLVYQENCLPLYLQPVFVTVLALYTTEQYYALYRTSESMRRRLLSSARIRNEFITAASHALQAPLSHGQRAADSLMSRRGDLPEALHPDVALLHATLDRMATMVREMTEYSSVLQSGGKPFAKSADVFAAAAAAVSLFAKEARARGVSLSNRVRPFSYRVQIDEQKLLQTLADVLESAVKLTSGKLIWISCEDDGDMAVIRIAGDGTRLSPDEFKRAVSPPSPTSPYEGKLSMELLTSRLLVERFGGTLTHDPLAKEGSSVLIRLPRASLLADTQAAALAEPQNGEAYGESKGRILAVIGEPVLLQTLARLLPASGYTVTVAADADRAIALLSDPNVYDLCLIGTLLSDASGYELCGWIRRRFSTLELPILYISSLPRPEDIVAALQAGANTTLTEPFETVELLARVNTLIQLQQANTMLLERETAFLQAQISPHFLFNALNVIISFCYTNPGRAASLLDSLSAFLRNSFSFSSTLSPVAVENELLLLHAYAELEQARFGERIQIEFAVEEETLFLRLLPLSVQPLLENAIRHVAGGPKGRCFVRISIRLTNSLLYVSVEDDGQGLLDSVRELMLRPEAPEKGVGLWNINRRLQNVYGQTLHIDKSELGGAKIWFTLPADTAASE